MKILYYVPNLQLCNGVASYLMNYYMNLINEGHKIDFLLSEDVDTPYYEKIKSNGSNIYFFPKKSINKRLNDILDNGYDIIHSNVINRGAFLLKIAKKRGCKVRILHSHTTSNGDTIIKRIIRWPLKKMALKNANYYFSCSEAAGNYLFGKKKFYVLNNAVDVERFKTEKSSNNTSIIAGTVGRLTKQKNPFFILDIVKELKEKSIIDKFIWIGNGELKEKIHNKARLYKLTEFIDFIDNTSEVEKFYSKMNIFILPSNYEGLPISGIEAQVAGLTCVFSDKISKEILINDNTYMIPLKKHLWIEMIANHLHDECLDNCAKVKYSLDNNFNILLNIYKEISNGK